jgi:non-specific serine/threonine protein kinase
VRHADDGLARQVRDALRHLYDPVYLQTHPLTRRLRADAAGPGPGGGAARVAGPDGAALRRCLLDAIAALQPPSAPPGATRGSCGPGGDLPGPGAAGTGAWRRYRLLDLRYVEGHDIPTVCRQLAVSRREYEREHRQGLDAVVSLLRSRWETGGAEPAPIPVLGRQEVGAAGGWPGPLPRPLTSLVGRAGEVAAVTQLLPRTRLLTLTGPAGVGKTRLAVAVASQLGPAFSAGAAFVPLASVAEPGLVPAAVARALAVREEPAVSLAASVAARLGDERLLLVLDNCEHLLSEAAPLVAGLLADCPGLTVLATSRAALRLSGEQEFPVPPLALPPATAPGEAAATAGTDAVRLFVERARAIDPAIRLTADSAPAVAAICRRLDGLPLAIELAAAGVRLFSPGALLARLESSPGALPLVAGAPRDAPARHRTLQAAIAWSHDLLSAGEQTLFRRLGVFFGGFTLAAAEAVAADPLEGSGVLEALEGLVAQSLVRREDGGSENGHLTPGGRLPGAYAPAESRPAPLPGSPAPLQSDWSPQPGNPLGVGPRFGMLETVREFALDQLQASGEGGAVRERHARCYFPLIDVGDAARDARWLDTVEREQGNLRAAMRWCMGQGDPAYAERGLLLAESLSRLSRRHGQLTQSQADLTWALAWPAPAAPGPGYCWARATVLTKTGNNARARGDFALARRYYQEGLHLRRRTGQSTMLPFSLCALGGLALVRGDLPTARACFGEAHAQWREHQRRYRCISLSGLGFVAIEEGEVGAARAYLEAALTLARAEGALPEVATAHDGLGQLLWGQGDLEGARDHHEAALTVARDLRLKGQVAAALDHLGLVAQAAGDAAGAGRRHAAALLLAQEIGDRLRVSWSLEGLAAVAATAAEGRRAARLLGAAAALREALGAPLPPSQRSWYERHLAAARAALPAPAFASAWAEGQALPLQQVIAEGQAAATPASTPRSAEPGAPPEPGIEPGIEPRRGAPLLGVAGSVREGSRGRGGARLGHAPERGA